MVSSATLPGQKWSSNLYEAVGRLFSTGRFLDALDYYTHAMPIDKPAVGMLNRRDIS